MFWKVRRWTRKLGCVRRWQMNKIAASTWIYVLLKFTKTLAVPIFMTVSIWKCIIYVEQHNGKEHFCELIMNKLKFVSAMSCILCFSLIKVFIFMMTYPVARYSIKLFGVKYLRRIFWNFRDWFTDLAPGV